MNIRKRRLGVFLGLLFVAPVAAQEPEQPVDPMRFSSKTVWSGASDLLMAQVRGTLEGIHPASLARRGRQPGLALEDGWQDAPIKQNLIIAVHGFYSNRDRAGAMLAGPSDAGFPVGRFEYASNQPIEESAKLLSQSLREIAEKQPERDITLLTHSLGGVVARAVVEDPELNPGNVTQLLMIAPPNHGSALASLGHEARPAAELEAPEEQVAVRLSQKLLQAAIGPAAEQLQLDSRFLCELNARSRNAEIHYAIFLGDKAPLPAGTAKMWSVAAEESDREWRWTRWVGDGVKRRLSDLAEIREGDGDGVVSLASGRLEGVTDVVVLHFHHNEPLWDTDDPAVEELYREVMERIDPATAAE